MRVFVGAMTKKQKAAHKKAIVVLPVFSITPFADAEKRVGNAGRHKPKENK